MGVIRHYTGAWDERIRERDKQTLEEVEYISLVIQQLHEPR